ncbi:MAG: hypothetical protein ACE5GL_03655 [Calditrichia bacterium]
MQIIFPRNFQYSFILFICLFFSVRISAGEPAQRVHSAEIHIVYTSNLNCQFDDCKCGGNLVGGFTRIATLFDSIKTAHPNNLILLDGGDFMSSYPLADANKVMLQIMTQGNYDAQIFGDQEFVEGENFIFGITRDLTVKLPFVTTNLLLPGNIKKKIPRVKMVIVMGIKIAIMGVIHPEAFDFIQTTPMLTEPISSVTTLALEISGESDIQILLFHGSWTNAQKMVEKNPWIDVVVMSHNQLKEFRKTGNTAFVESGVDGEYIGYLTLEIGRNSLKFSNQFIPVTANIQENKTIKDIAKKYYDNLDKHK